MRYCHIFSYSLVRCWRCRMSWNQNNCIWEYVLTAHSRLWIQFYVDPNRAGISNQPKIKSKFLNLIFSCKKWWINWWIQELFSLCKEIQIAQFREFVMNSSYTWTKKKTRKKKNKKRKLSEIAILAKWKGIYRYVVCVDMERTTDERIWQNQ